MKNNSKNNPRPFGQWTQEQKLDKTQKKLLKGGANPWLENK